MEPTESFFIYRSGTVNVADVDSFWDPVLDKYGEIGIILDDGRMITNCTKWVNQEYRTGGRLECPLPCPPTLELFKNVTRGTWQWRYRREKAGSYCVFSNAWRVYPPMKCCYDNIFGFLVDTVGAGAGRAHRYHPRGWWWRWLEIDTLTAYNLEEAAYDECCSDPSSESCRLFYSLRPPCNSSNWKTLRPKLSRYLNYIIIPILICPNA